MRIILEQLAIKINDLCPFMFSPYLVFFCTVLFMLLWQRLSKSSNLAGNTNSNYDISFHMQELF